MYFYGYIQHQPYAFVNIKILQAAVLKINTSYYSTTKV